MVTRVARADGASYLGPFRSSAAAHRVREAIEDAVPLRRCGNRIGAQGRCSTTGRRAFPRSSASRRARASAQIDEDAYGELADTRAARAARRTRRCCARRSKRACAGWPTSSGSKRRRRPATGSATLTQALQRQRAMDALRGATRLVIDRRRGPRRARPRPGRARRLRARRRPATATTSEPPDLELPPGRAEADELLLVHRWLQRARGVRCHDATGVAASRLPRAGAYRPPLDE